MPANEASFDRLAGVPVHYDRLPAPNEYGSKGQRYTYYCRTKLKSALNSCFSELFDVWGYGNPSIILGGSTLGDGMNAHGRGNAFDLDGFYWGDRKFTMAEYPSARRFYIGINAHLFLHFPQVLGYHYPGHRDHFHVDFSFSKRFRPASNAQTFFLQSSLVYLFGRDIGISGEEGDGVDGVYDGDTRAALHDVLREVGLREAGGLKNPKVWQRYLSEVRTRGFS